MRSDGEEGWREEGSSGVVRGVGCMLIHAMSCAFAFLLSLMLTSSAQRIGPSRRVIV